MCYMYLYTTKTLLIGQKAFANLSQMTNSRTPNSREFADDNFKLDANGRKLSKPEENTVRKGEIAHYQQFLLFPQYFRRTCNTDT